MEQPRARPRKKKSTKLTHFGLPSLDRLLVPPALVLDDYLAAVSEYVRENERLSDGVKKAAQIRLSSALGEILLAELQIRLPALRYAVAGEHKVSGALRTVNADVSETHPLDGLRLGIEIKPVNLAVGRALWNRFGDIRTFAVNIHLKFPFAVVGGVLVIPEYEVGAGGVRKSTETLIRRACERLNRAGGRRTEADAPHLLEGIAVLVYNPETGKLSDTAPDKDSRLRWYDFVDSIVLAYKARFED